MKFIKIVEEKEIVEFETNKNHFNLLEREGFKRVVKSEKPKKVELDKE